MITGIVSRPVVAHSLSSVTPSVSGIQMSSSTRSGRMRCARGARLRRVFRQLDGVAFVVEDFREQVADAQFVIDHQDVCHVVPRLLLAARVSDGRCC